MGERKKPAEILAENVRRLRAKVGAPSSLGVSAKTANNVVKHRHQVQLDTIVAIAKALKVEPYHLLIPAEDEKFLSVILAWAHSDERGRDDLHTIAEAILKRRQVDEEKASAAAVHRQRSRAG